MPIVNYVGEDGVDENGKAIGGRHLGRHGFVKKGQSLSISNDEFAMIADDDNFELVADKSAKTPAK